MTGTISSSVELDTRRRKALFRAWHRGMREVDLIVGGFADREMVNMSESELCDFERLLEEPDGDLLKWVTGERPVPATHDHALFARMRGWRGKGD